MASRTAEPNVVDRVVAFISPERGLKRQQARAHLSLMDGGYKGARRGRRATQMWSTRGNSSDADTLPDLAALRERSRDLSRNTPLATGAINTVVTNVVGTGLDVHPQIDARYLGLGEDAAQQWERDAKRLFGMWAGVECDLSRTQDFMGLQDLAFRSALESGDVFAVNSMVARPGSPFEFKLSLFEADQVSNPQFRADTANLAGGVEIDGNHAPSAYYFMEQHPGAIRPGSPKWRRVPAFGAASGRRNVIHLYHRIRPGQTRGVPYLAPVIESMKQLGDYSEAELMAAVIGAMITVVYKTSRGGALPPNEPAAETGGQAGDTDYKMSPGGVLELKHNDDITVNTPGRPNANYNPFVKAIIEEIGPALEIPFEVLTKHFESSYSASRAALEVAWQFFRKRRVWLARGLCQPTYENVLGEAVAKGWISAPGFFGDPFIHRAYTSALWIGPGRISIDPLRENNADKIAEEQGWKTSAENTAEKTGGSWEAKHAQRAREQRMRVNDGLAAPIGGAAAPAQPADRNEGPAKKALPLSPEEDEKKREEPDDA